MKFGDRMKQLRHEREWTQPELAERIGIEQSYLSKLENDKSLPSGEVIEHILSAFDMSLSDYLGPMDAVYIRRHLKTIPLVADFINQQQRQHFHQRRRWLAISGVLITVGLTALIGGWQNLLFNGTAYQYRSYGVIKPGESAETFIYWMKQNRNNLYAPEVEQLKAIRARLDEQYLSSYEYQGEIYQIDVSGGRRTFSLYSETQVVRTENNLLMLLGVLLLLSGLVTVVLEHRLANSR